MTPSRRSFVRTAALVGGALATGAARPGLRPPAQDSESYRTVTMRASPGRLLELIELLREERAHFRSVGDAPGLWMRHSQGDHWDLLMMYPLGASMGAWFADARVAARRSGNGARLQTAVDDATAWREDVFVRGAPESVVRPRWEAAGLFHVEMFIALAGFREELLREREMENDYLERTGRRANLIFVREAGAATDNFSVGFYRDLRHYAEGSSATPEEQERAAVAAGFQGTAHIGPYMREFVAEHHDTLAVAIP
ncbi:MAG: twin-arginine translocation signal domain-containing protein [Longimicrobiales bacterium]